MIKVAVISDGTAPHEMHVHVVAAKNYTEALLRVAETILKNWRAIDPEMYQGWYIGEVHNNCSPTYQVEIYNNNSSVVLDLWTSDVTILDDIDSTGEAKC